VTPPWDKDTAQWAKLKLELKMLDPKMVGPKYLSIEKLLAHLSHVFQNQEDSDL